MTKANDMPNLRVSYDDIADVLYLSVGLPDRSARTREDDAGLLWRVSRDGFVKGVTVMAFHQHWDGRQSELADILALRMSLPVSQMSRQLELAH